MTVPAKPKIYHILHINRLSSIIADEYLWCDAKIFDVSPSGTAIGMGHIKKRRLKELTLTRYPDLHVGDCVPFYFCPRSVMLYLLNKANNSDLTYLEGQEPIIHLEADLHATIAWAEQNNRRWAFTLSNAGAYYFEDCSDLSKLNEINWEAVQTNHWSGNGIQASVKEGKQAEFLLEDSFPWELVECIGVYSQAIRQQVINAFLIHTHQPRVEVSRQ